MLVMVVSLVDSCHPCIHCGRPKLQEVPDRTSGLPTSLVSTRTLWNSIRTMIWPGNPAACDFSPLLCLLLSFAC